MKIWVPLVAGAAIVAVSGTLAFTALAPTATTAAATASFPREHFTPPPLALTFAASGDSLTAGCELDLTVPAPLCTWPGVADSYHGLMLVGGNAHPGDYSLHIANKFVAGPEQVRVILAGTNDVRNGWAWDEEVRNLQRMTSVTAGYIVLVALPPSNDYPAQTVQRNVLLQQYAASQGYGWVDPWTGWSTPEYRWAEGGSLDGIHPTDPLRAEMGGRIAEYLLSLPIAPLGNEKSAPKAAL